MNNKELCEDIARWLKDYLEGKGKPLEARTLKSFIIGVSGGIDSAVVSTLCAMTGKPTIAINIPVQSNVGSTVLAQQHCRWLETKYSDGNVRVLDVDITRGYEVLVSLLPGDHSLANANLKSRLRMSVLYHYATIYNGIVVGTGNKVEDFGVGFFTKYGDGAVDISPIADLMKSEVRECAKELGILSSVVEAPPSDGLWGSEDKSHTDEQQLGASYDELEWAMKHNENTHIVQVLTGRQQEVLSLYRKLNIKNQHKMIPIPRYTKLT